MSGPWSERKIGHLAGTELADRVRRIPGDFRRHCQESPPDEEHILEMGFRSVLEWHQAQADIADELEYRVEHLTRLLDATVGPYHEFFI